MILSVIRKFSMEADANVFGRENLAWIACLNWKNWKNRQLDLECNFEPTDSNNVSSGIFVLVLLYQIWLTLGDLERFVKEGRKGCPKWGRTWQVLVTASFFLTSFWTRKVVMLRMERGPQKGTLLGSESQDRCLEGHCWVFSWFTKPTAHRDQKHLWIIFLTVGKFQRPSRQRRLQCNFSKLRGLTCSDEWQDDNIYVIEKRFGYRD